MGIPVLLIFAAVWYLPLFLKHRKWVKEPFRYYLFAWLAGMSAVILSIGLQFGIGFLTKDIQFSDTAEEIVGALKVLIIVAFVEEMLKFLFGYVIVNKVPNLTEAGCMLIVGAVGVGFETLETAGTFNILSAVLRGISALHIMFQLWMGKFWFRARQAKLNGDKEGRFKNLCLALVLPIFAHAAFDYLLLKASAIGLSENGSNTVAVIMLASSLTIAAGVIVVTLISAYRTVKAERLSNSPIPNSPIEEKQI